MITGSIGYETSKVKYRPSLPSALITHILALANAEHPMSMESCQVIAILAPFQAKIEVGAVAPASVAVPKQSIEESIGLDAPKDTPKEEYWEFCYIQWTKYPNSLTPQQLQGADEHRYLHNLMSAEEITQFELSA